MQKKNNENTMKETKKIIVKSDGTGLTEVLDEVTLFTIRLNYIKKDSTYIRLLTEEALGLVRALVTENEAVLWLEGDADICRIHLEIETKMDPMKREAFLDVSSSKKNEATKGSIIAKIRDIFEQVVENQQMADQYQIAQTVKASDDFWVMGASSESSDKEKQWSLEKYRRSLNQQDSSSLDSKGKWDELEKSVVANLADDVRVSIYPDKVEMVLDKKTKVNKKIEEEKNDNTDSSNDFDRMWAGVTIKPTRD